MSLDAMPSSTLRIGDAERDACVASLINHHLDGRLSVEEYDRRQRAALAAVNAEDLAVLLADLPTAGVTATRSNGGIAAPGASDKVVSAAINALPVGAVIGCAWLSQVAWQLSAEGPFLGAIAGGAVGYAARAAVTHLRR